MESCQGQDILYMILYLTGNEHFLVTMPISNWTKSEKGGWVNGSGLHPAASSLARYSMMTSGPRLISNYLKLCSFSHPQSQYSHHVQCHEAACYIRLSLDDLLGTCKSYWDVVVTEPPRLHQEAGCSCLQLQQICPLCNGVMCICPVGSYYNLLSHCRTICPIAWVRWDLDGLDFTVCLTCKPFFVISTISREAVWGKGHPSTKWSKPPHWKHLWTKVITVVALRIVAIRAWSMVVKGQL